MQNIPITYPSIGHDDYDDENDDGDDKPVWPT
jgi:hypothetical protein